MSWAVWLVAITFSVRLVSAHPYDFETYYAAAESLRFDHGANIYSVATLLHTAQVHGNCAPFPDFAYVYPPLLAIILMPLTLASCSIASVIWLIMNATLWAVTTVLLWSLLATRWPERRLEAGTIITVISLGFWHVFDGLFLGQAHLIVLCCMALALCAIERRYDRLAGGLLALGALIKFFPVALIIYCVACRRFRVAGGAAIVSVCLLAISAEVAGPTALLRSLSAAAVSVGGQATSGGLNESLIVTIPSVGYALAGLIGLTFLGVVVHRQGDDLLGGAWAISTALLVSPLVWSFYLAWLIPAFCACLAAIGPLRRGALHGIGAWGLLIVLYCILAFPLSLALRPFATLALWALTGALYWRSARFPVYAANGEHARLA